MISLLESGRVVFLAGQQHWFDSFSDLANLTDQISIQLEEKAMSLSIASSAEVFRMVDVSSTRLHDCLIAQEEWLADHDAGIGKEIETVLSEIQNLNASSAI